MSERTPLYTDDPVGGKTNTGGSDGNAFHYNYSNGVGNTASGEPKVVGCACGATHCCVCWTKTQWITCQLVCSMVTLLIGGLLWIFMGPLLYGVTQQIVFVTSPDSFMYESWECTWVEGGSLPPVPYYENFYLFNLTNVDDVLQGGIPVVQELGPFVYRTNITKYNVEFLEDNTLVDYIYSKTFIYQPDLSTSLPESTPVTMLNPGYLGALYEAGSESLIILILVGPAVDKMVKDIETYYIIDRLIPQYGFEGVLSRCQDIDPKCSTTRDMAIVQWGYYQTPLIGPPTTSKGLYDETVNDVLPDIFPSRAEYSAFPWVREGQTDEDQPILIDAFNKLLYGDYGLVTDPANFEAFALAVPANRSDEMQEKWGLTGQQGFFFQYATAYMFSTYSNAVFEKALEDGSGLFSTKTAYEWLWSATDPLLEYLFPSSPYVLFIGNSTSPDDMFVSRWRVHTGKYTPDSVTNVTAYDNQTSLNWFENAPVDVTGNAGTGIFPPTKANGRGQIPTILPDILVWSPDHGGSINFIDTGKVDVLEGISTHRYELVNETYDTDHSRDRYYDLDPRFVGFVNSTFKDMVPLYLCQPHFSLVTDNYWREHVHGVIEADYERDLTSFNVEPLTGLGLAGLLQLQANFYLANRTYFGDDSLFKNVTLDVIYPAFYVQQVSRVTPELAEIVNVSIVAQQIITGLWIALMVIGSAAVVLNVARLVTHKRNLESGSYYTTINT